jgi:type I restriction enzyme R subunit
MSALNESHVEDAALEWFGELGYAVGHGPQLAPGEPATERNRSAAQMDGVNSFGEVVLVGRLREAIRRLNPAIPEEARATIWQFRACFSRSDPWRHET